VCVCALAIIDVTGNIIQTPFWLFCKILDDVLTSQGHFLRGPESSAIKGCVKTIHECVARLVAEKEAKSSVKDFLFSTPQGEEVYHWLSEQGLSQYTSSFVSVRLNSLRKISRMTSDDLFKVHQKFCSSTAHAELAHENDDVGSRVFLEEAVQALKDDPRTKTLQEQLDDFRDPKVSGLNLMGANHQLEVLMAQRGWRWFFLSALLCAGLYQGFGAVTGFARLSNIITSGNILTYGVQLSTNGTLWIPVVAKDGNGDAYLFDSSALASKPGNVVSALFPQEEKARYIKILPGTWEGMRVQDLNQKTYSPTAPDLRLAVLGALGREGALPYRVLSDGSPDQAWVQLGCSFNHNSSSDAQAVDAAWDGQPQQNSDNVLRRWAQLHEKIGEVQCCLNSQRPGVHVCTRDG
jgi:hypothetical protein